MSISKEVPWPKIVTDSGEIPMKRRYAFRDMSYLDTLEARPIFETQADIIIKNNFKGIVDVGCRHGPINDFLHDKMIKKADIVMSSGTIDNTYDVPLFIEQMVSAAEKYIYISAYKGWFPEVEQHIYKYEKESGYYNNIISPSAVCRQLRKLGCTEISARPIMTGHDDIPFETEIFAKISCN